VSPSLASIHRSSQYLAGIANTAYFGAEAESCIFDGVQFDSTVNGAFYEVQ
jgi:glutamine synthetase